LQAQDEPLPKQSDSIYFLERIDSLKAVYYNCRNIPQEYEIAFYTAVSHYPELKDYTIEIKPKFLHFTMAARPATRLFSNRNSRVYRIYTNVNKNSGGILAATLTYNQKVGIIGHELGHVLDYTHKSLCQLINTGIGYMFVSYRRKMEKNTDLEAIRHGLGWQLYDYKDFLFNHSGVDRKYLKKISKVYLNEKEFKALLPNIQNQIIFN